jgi:hypothetical protein
MRPVQRVFRALDWIILLPLIPSALLLKFVRRAGLDRLPLTRKLLVRLGVLPIRRNYYEPWFDASMLDQPLEKDRDLPGLDLKPDSQLKTLATFEYAEELATLEGPDDPPLGFRFGNPTFNQGDAELLYSVIRSRKPRRVFEIGSGNSTLVARKAIQRNSADDPGYSCEHLCVEPYEMPWLGQTGVTVVRERVEKLGVEFFSALESGDLLFIDSTHIIRPQGDVLFEFLELLPSLRKGVLIHVHDIFTPKDYPADWVLGSHRFWNEQYLLEAFLTQNPDWSVYLAANYLKHHHFGELKAACPHIRQEHEPGSFYVERAR